MATDDGTEYQPRDFVYLGRREGRNGVVLARIAQIENGQLADFEAYSADTFKKHIVGGIYRGATFCEGGAKGLSGSTWVGRWHGEQIVMEAKVLDDAVTSMLRSKKLMADSKKINEIEAMLLPLRKLYAAYARKYDHAGKEALEAAVLRALRAAPRKSELDQ